MLVSHRNLLHLEIYYEYFTLRMNIRPCDSQNVRLQL